MPSRYSTTSRDGVQSFTPVATLSGIAPPAVVKADFRKACGQFATGVTIVTVRDGDGAHGMTANSFTSVSLDPPLVLVSVDRNRRTHELIGPGDRFAVSVLADEHQAWSDRFAGRQGTELQCQFDDVPHVVTADGLPVIEGALASFVCCVDSVHPAGDHSLFVGLVEQVEFESGKTPLVFFTGGYRTIGVG